MSRRRFLFLQGPHGPFFGRLAERLAGLGHSVCRIGVNQGDRWFWPRRLPYVAFRDPPEHWEAALRAEMGDVTDLVVYSDTRPMHRTAIALGSELGLRIHVFEEGYLRPYWITYERDGANGNSPMMAFRQEQIDTALGAEPVEPPAAPATWGALRQHMFYGALYHFCVLALNRGYPHFQPHRDVPVADELRLYLKLLAGLGPRLMSRALAERRLRRQNTPYHLVLLQLAHDASFRDHGPFASQAAFIDCTMEGFRRGAPQGHSLVFKTHPLEDGREPLTRLIRERAATHGLAQRVHVISGGKLARLLDDAASVVTVNSTAAQQALWRGLPVKAFGKAIYAQPHFVDPQPLADFFHAPMRPNLAAYRRFRMYLLRSCQLRGSFYSSRGRRQALRGLPDMMLSSRGPHHDIVAGRNSRGKSASSPMLKVVD